MRFVRTSSILALFLVASAAFAQWSLVLGTVLPSGAQKVDSYNQAGVYNAATGVINDIALKVGEVCISHEVYIYQSGTSMASKALFLESMASNYVELARSRTVIVFEADGGLGTALGEWLELDSGTVFLIACAT